jgi:hypothetical protein
MDDKQAGRATERSLKEVMRTIRVREAERTGVVVALRDAELARLDALKDRLDPVIAQVPAGVDLFDTGLTPGDPPRLWIDMVSFVEMSRDKRVYRFLQDTRVGRTIIMESEAVDDIADAVTAYMAQRLIERERMILGRAAPAPASAATVAAPPADTPRAVPARAAAMPETEVQSALATIMAAARDAAGATAGPAQPASPPPSLAPAAETPPAARLVTGTATPVIGNATEPVPTPAPAAAQPEPLPPPVTRAPRREGVRFGWAAMIVVLLLGLAIGAGSVLAIAMLAARGG